MVGSCTYAPLSSYYIFPATLNAQLFIIRISVEKGARPEYCLRSSGDETCLLLLVSDDHFSRDRAKEHLIGC